jgi:hypothetical protein
MYLLKGWNFTRDRYIWYASYGSNTLNERFYCYLKGGQIAGNNRKFKGCRDPSLPIDESPVLFNHALYFAKRSGSWNGGGVAFVNVESSPDQRTLGKMFLIKKCQLPEILQQENNRDVIPVIDFDELLRTGSTIAWNDAWYGRLIYLGTKRSHGIVTFTHATNQNVFRSPSREYLETIIKGLRTSHSLSNQDLATYLSGLQGIAANYSQHELNEIINNA